MSYKNFGGEGIVKVSWGVLVKYYGGRGDYDGLKFM